MISGGGWGVTGRKVQVISPTGNVSCRIPDLPGGRGTHSMNNNTICGGQYTEGSRRRRRQASDSPYVTCLKLTPSGWSRSHTLRHARAAHSSWQVEDGIILLGGWGSRNTSEIAKTDGTTEESFNLKYDTGYVLRNFMCICSIKILMFNNTYRVIKRIGPVLTNVYCTLIFHNIIIN